MGQIGMPRPVITGTGGGAGGGGGGGTDYENVEVRPIPGAPGLLGLYINGELDGTFPASSLEPPTAPLGHAPPAFSTTEAGIAFQADQDRQLAAQGDIAAQQRLEAEIQADIDLAAAGDKAAMDRVEAQGKLDMALAIQGDTAARDRLEFSEGEAFRRLEFSEAEAWKRAVLAEGEAFKRTMAGEVGAGVRSQMEAESAFRNMLGGEVGAGSRAELGELGALLRGRENIAGSGAEAGLGAFSTQRGQSIDAVTDTFGNLRDLAAAPSDFLRLAYNAQGTVAPGATPTDQTRGAMQDFFRRQTEFANREAPTFADLYNQNRGAVGGATTLPGWGDLFAQNRDRIGGFGPASSFADLFNEARGQVGGFQYGGSPGGGGGTFRNAAITGERGQPELVTGDNINVTPNLSKGEMAMLKRGGVGGRQFGDEPERGPGKNVFDVPSLRSGYRAPGFSGGFRRAAKGGVGGVTGLEPIDPLEFSLQDFLRRRPFEQQMLLSQFGESIVDPNDPRRIMRAGIDPTTALEMMRRSSLTGSIGRSRYG